jgi:CHAD domain-containing protein
MADSEASQFTAASVFRLLDNVTRERARTRRMPDADAVHDVRVAIRRACQALAVFKPCFAPKPLKRLRRSLKQTLELAGEVRNCDIALDHLAQLRKPAPEGLVRRIQARRKASAASLVAYLKKPVGSRPRPMAAFAAQFQTEALDRARARFRESAEVVRDAKASAKQLHELRLAAKKLRYTLELLHPDRTEDIARIARVQGRLGRMNDCRTIRSIVVQAGGDSAIENALKRKQRRREREFRKLWRDEFARKPLPEKKPAARSAAASSGAAKRA